VVFQKILNIKKFSNPSNVWLASVYRRMLLLLSGGVGAAWGWSEPPTGYSRNPSRFF
jgi:hypothetical protein